MKKRRIICFVSILSVIVFLNLLAWKSRTFCDFYVENIYPVWVNILGRITSLFSFSVGEIMLITGLSLLLAAVALFLVLFVFALFFKKSRIFPYVEKVCGIFYKSLAWAVLSVALIMTLNCYILYHATGFGEKYLTGGEVADMADTREELAMVRDYVVQKVNLLSLQVERDENGAVVCPDNLAQETIASMRALGKQYSQLSGYYPTPKEIQFSGFLSQQHMAGYFFPFSMETNYNGLMEAMNKPFTMCHELAHVRGFLHEEDANMIAFLACTGSDESAFEYSGYLGVLYYLDNDFYDSLDDKSEYHEHAAILPQVHTDNMFLTDEAWVEVEEKAVVDTDTVSEFADMFVETTLVLNGVEEGADSYSRVVELLLRYYQSEDELE